MSRLLSVSVPDELAAETEALVRATGKTKSEVVRDALRNLDARRKVAGVRVLAAADMPVPTSWRPC